MTLDSYGMLLLLDRADQDGKLVWPGPLRKIQPRNKGIESYSERAYTSVTAFLDDLACKEAAKPSFTRQEQDRRLQVFPTPSLVLDSN